MPLFTFLQSSKNVSNLYMQFTAVSAEMITSGKAPTPFIPVHTNELQGRLYQIIDLFSHGSLQNTVTTLKH